MKDLFPLLSNGRIENIIYALKKTYKVENISSLSTDIKLEALCLTLGLDVKTFDKMLANNSPVLRTVKVQIIQQAILTQ